MKRMLMSVLVIGLTAITLNGANAGGMKGMGDGCGDCAKQGGASEPFRKFQADTIDLRQEMMLKRFEVQRENLKAVPDAAKVVALQADIKNIQAKIQSVRSMSGLPMGKSDGECAPKGGGMGGCGKGQGDCNGMPCGMQK